MEDVSSFLHAFLECIVVRRWSLLAGGRKVRFAFAMMASAVQKLPRTA
jgi:hypothetical protein